MSMPRSQPAQARVPIRAAASTPALTPARKCAYALGDFSNTTAFSILSLIYASYFLVTVAELRPVLAGLIPLVGRVLDAITDPLMGRISDATRWRWGRRRPYFLLGAVPLGITFALMWVDAPFDGQAARFAYYAIMYCALTSALTIVSVPHLALQPEMVLDYDERTSLTTFRNIAGVFGVVSALGVRPLAESLGGGFDGFTAAGAVYGVVLTLPWFVVWKVSFERDEFRTRPTRPGFRSAVSAALASSNFRRLIGLYLTGRIAMDLVASILVLYFTHYIRRSGDFELLMILFLSSAAFALPFWLWISRSYEKVAIFRFGCLWWSVAQLLLLVATPDWPRWTLIVFAPLAAVGYAAVDLMPWSMVGDVIDEDDLMTGERREGLYHGIFLFLRKLGGALGVFLALSVLDLAGLASDGPQPESARTAIRLLASAGPALFLLWSFALANGYALTRAEHSRVRAVLVERARERSAESATVHR